MNTRKRKSLSSILKTQMSPSRMALADLNPNLNGPSDETTQFEMEPKKRRRSSRRVSFAETYQVKEFLKDSEAKQLGLWNDSNDSVSNPASSGEDKNSSAPSSEPGPSEGVSMGPGHHIQGLETLLSGPIKQEARTMTLAMQEPSDHPPDTQTLSHGTVSHLALKPEDDCSLKPLQTDSNDGGITSSFLKSFIAAGPATTESCSTSDFLVNVPVEKPSTRVSNAASSSTMGALWSSEGAARQQDDGDEERVNPGGFKSSFLQSFIAAKPEDGQVSSIGRPQMDTTKVFEQGDADGGMEFTACLNSTAARGDGKRWRDADENAGEITRIFGGGLGDVSGMDMTTCIGGFDATECRGKLEHPAAESTRIFGNELTDNMDLTGCLRESEDTGKNGTQGRVMNTTTFEKSMDFTAVLGKFSKSDMSNLPDESTGKLLGRIDAFLNPQESNEAEAAPPSKEPSSSSQTDAALCKPDHARRSVVLDTIHEVSSSTASMLNVTSGEKSGASILASVTSLDVCPEGDDMEMTTCNAVPLSLKAASEAEQTKVFEGEDTEAMEMTCALGGKVQSVVSKTQPVPVGDAGDETRVFGSEDAAAMEMTCTVNEHVPAAIHESRRGGNETRIFDFEDTGAMEMTCTVSEQVPPAETNPMSAQSRDVGDVTRVFDSEDTAAMEMTCPVGGLHSTGSKSLSLSTYDKTLLPRDSTSRCHSMDTTKMELTACLGHLGEGLAYQLQKKGERRVQADMSHPADHHTKNGGEGEQTCFFDNEDAGKMEITECLSQHEINNQAKQANSMNLKPSTAATSDSLSQSKFSFGEETRFFRSEATANMDMTDCQKGLLPEMTLPSSSTCSLSPPKAVMSPDHTKVFQPDDNCGMEMTASYGVISIGSQLSTKPDATTADKEPEKTCFFQSEETACMEIAECHTSKIPLQGPVSIPQSHSTARLGSIGRSADEHTRVFENEHTANMEMTACVGSLQSHEGVAQTSIIHATMEPKPPGSSDDHTHFFQSEDTANMDMTTCGGVPLSHVNNKALPQADSHSSKDATKHSHSEDEGTAAMDITACQDKARASSVQVAHSSDSCSRVSDIRADHTTGKDLTNVGNLGLAGTELLSRSIREDTLDAQLDAVPTNETSKQHDRLSSDGNLDAMGEMTLDKTSDTYTLSSPTTGQEKQQTRSDESKLSISISNDGRRSDTFTIETACPPTAGEEEGENGPELSSSKPVQPSVCHNSTLPELRTEPKASSTVSDDGMNAVSAVDGAEMNKSAVAEASSSLKDSILPDWVCEEDDRGILEELPIDNDNTEDLCVASLAKRTCLDESAFSMSQLNASALTCDLSHLPSLPTTGPVSLSTFLQEFGDFSDLPEGKPSIMCPRRFDEPTTLAEQLQSSCITKPKGEMFEWAINFLTPSTKTLKEAVANQEAKYSEDTPALITEMQNATPERMAAMRRQVVSLQKYCTQSTKAKLKSWRLKMTKNVQSSMEDSCKRLDSKLAKVTESLTAIEQYLEDIKSLEATLDTNLADLEQIHPPSEEEKAELLEGGARLATVTTALKEKEESVRHAESERGTLEAEKSRLQGEIIQLETEREDLRQWTGREGDGVSETETDLARARQEVIMIQRLQEWKLTEFADNCYKFSFLCDSLIVVAQYGDDAQLSGLKMESRLADDACASAQLAHSVFFSSIDDERLKSLYPTRAALPLLMQHLSDIAIQARLLEAECSEVDFWHPITVTRNRLSVKFFSEEAHSMFSVHLDLLPGQYPATPIPCTCTVRFGSIREESICEVMNSVTPGWRYVTRLVSTIKDLVRNHHSV
ncbi:uncharacterized protein [Diadema setosum]|uniref:uncharacterized protein n=1 Tax=Diadema setosum TaxID=31175 RepID=UPI003B3A8847